MIPGIYIIFGPANRVYVGESSNVPRRNSVRFARRIGLDWTIVQYMPASTEFERRDKECLVKDAYTKAGYVVVSQHNGDFGNRFRRGSKAYLRRWTPERRKAHSEAMKRLWKENPEKLLVGQRTGHTKRPPLHERTRRQDSVTKAAVRTD